MSRSSALKRVADLFAHGESPPSRNVAYEAYRSPAFVTAVRLHRHLRTLADDLIALRETSTDDDDSESAGVPFGVTVEHRPDCAIAFAYAAAAHRRVAVVRPDELSVLFLDEQVAEVLRALNITAPGQTR